MPYLVALFLLLAAPLHAWEARAGLICELSHATNEADVLLTYDPAGPLYTITLTRKGDSWVPAPVFAMRFDGPNQLTISTSRHGLSKGGAALSVADTGFGNVLNGLQFNSVAVAMLGDQALSIPLTDAAPAVQAFRSCTTGALS